MRSYGDIRAQQENVDEGGLKVTVMTADGTRPVENALVRISYTGESGQTIEEVRTDSSGQTPVLEVKTPPLEYSMEPSEQQPYAEYTVQVEAEGFENSEVAGTQVLPSVLAQQTVSVNFQANASFERLVIGPHTLWGEYPPKIEEAEVKPVDESGEIVLSRVVVPEYIVVHDGPVNDNTAQDYYVRYKDYIKNVASSEIYATWPDDTIRANVLAIMSFTLNRVYTEWYRNKGKDFTITSSTAYDHKWIHGRNIFDSISRIVDELFENYLSRPDVRQPILTQYCDGRQVQCRNRGWMTQWGSKSLGDQGYSPIEILRYFYGNDIYVNVAEAVSGIPSSWPGYDLNIGATGNKVRQIQEQLNVISDAYPAIPKVGVDGIYGEQTKNSVRKFQDVFGLPETGITDYPTWYKIQEIYVAVSRIAELN
ncbi:peptidoglycan-binding protein [Blautia sp.]|uniref:peptidoglycan-binding protein n=1 Tax=Blautia sp. TaxID=1955243 RepID=UPI0025C615D0|nr:peptidoglycan-binding protein [Blautia sp.]